MVRWERLASATVRPDDANTPLPLLRLEDALRANQVRSKSVDHEKSSFHPPLPECFNVVSAKPEPKKLMLLLSCPLHIALWLSTPSWVRDAL